MMIGPKIKEIREKQQMTLSELSKKSGVQIATLSRIENSKMTGTISSHFSIAKALGINITDLYGETSSAVPQPLAVEQPAHSETFTYNEKSSYEILANKVLAKKMMPMVLRIEKGGKTQPEQHSPGAEKFIFLLEGALTASIGGQNFTLSRHQTLYFDAAVSHHYENIGNETVKAIVVVTPVNL